MTNYNLIFFSGLAADQSVFAAQRSAFPTLQVVRWIEPRSDEDLQSYACRAIRPYANLPNLVLGGASFGGIVAQFAAEQVPARCVILIGSAREPDSLPWFAKLFRPLKMCVPLLPVRLMQLLAKAAIRLLVGLHSMSHYRAVLAQFADCNIRVFTWSLKQLLSWKVKAQLSVPVLEIHGARDRILPLASRFDGQVIQQGGHVISLSHPDQVNQFIEDALRKLSHS